MIFFRFRTDNETGGLCFEGVGASFSSWCLGWAVLFYCGMPLAIQTQILCGAPSVWKMKVCLWHLGHMTKVAVTLKFGRRRQVIELMKICEKFTVIVISYPLPKVI